MRNSWISEAKNPIRTFPYSAAPQVHSEPKKSRIGLLEELRRDDPNISDRPDEHADALSAPADPLAVACPQGQSHSGREKPQNLFHLQFVMPGEGDTPWP